MEHHRLLSVIGSCSHDTILQIRWNPNWGDSTKAERHKELGGRGTNTAVAAYRCSHNQPDTPDHLLAPEPRTWESSESGIEVRLIGAVADESERDKFATLCLRNGVNPDYLEIKGAEQDYSETLMNARDGKNTFFYNFGCADQWTVDDFDTPEKLGGGVRPDLVVVTMDLKTAVVERIIEVAHEANIELILYACPGEPILQRLYPKVTHLICNESDAAKMLGYMKADSVNIKNWQEVVDDFYTSKAVKNVVLKAGSLGAYYKNDNAEGYSSGYKRIEEIEDATGATAAFVGNYAVEILRQKANGQWRIGEAVDRGNIACAVVVEQVGYQNALPWADEIERIENDQEMQPLYADLDAAKAAQPKKRGNVWNRG